ncbi:MAG: DUF5615 family PIN-like protein [Candidatus Binatia bacterium]
MNIWVDAPILAAPCADEDFVDLVLRHGPPLQVIWVRSGNMSNAHFKALLSDTFRDALALIERGKAINRAKA